MTKVKKEVVAEVPAAPCAGCVAKAQQINELNIVLEKYKTGFKTLKMKLETIFNITQL